MLEHEATREANNLGKAADTVGNVAIRYWALWLAFLGVVGILLYFVSSDAGFFATARFFLAFILMSLLPGALVIKFASARVTLFESLIIGSVVGVAVLALGVFMSALTGAFWVRYLPVVLLYFLVAFIAIRRRSAGVIAGLTSPRKTETTIVLGALLGLPAALVVTLRTLRHQSTSWLESWSYYVDLPWQVALTAEAGNRVPEYFPYLEGAELKYTYAFHAAMGQLSLASGTSAAEAVLQFWPAIYVLLLVGASSAVAFRLGNGSRLATLFAATSVGLLSGIPVGQDWFYYRMQISPSPTQEFANLLVVAFVWAISLGTWLDSERAAKKVGYYLGVAVLVFVGAAAKGSSGFIFLGIASTILFISLITRTNRKNSTALFIVTMSAVLLALVLIVGQSGGLVFSGVNLLDERTVMSVATVWLWAVGGILLAWLTNLSRAPTVTALLFTAAMSTSVILATTQPGRSEFYFFYSASILLILGLAVVMGHLVRRFGWQLLLPLVAAGALYFALAPILSTADGTETLLLLFLALPLVISGFWAFISSTYITPVPKPAWRIPFIAGLAILGTFGFQSLGQPSQAFSGPGVGEVTVTGDEASALSYLRGASPSGALIATNVHCHNAPTPDFNADIGCRSFIVSALSERRVLIEGWLYTAAGHISPANSKPLRELLELNEEALTSPTEASIDRLRQRGVTHLYLSGEGAADQDYSDFATLEFRGKNVAVWRIHP